MTQSISSPVLLAPRPHSGVTVAEFYSMHFMGAVFPLTAGVLLYGWRALLLVGIVIGSTTVMILIWRRIGPRGQALCFSHGLWLSLLLSLMLPAHLASGVGDPGGQTRWLVPAAAGACLAIFMWLLGGLGAGRIHPVLVTYLVMAAMFGDLLTPHSVLNRDRLFLGDVLRATTPQNLNARDDLWITRKHRGEFDAERSDPASDALLAYTIGREKPPRGWLPLGGLLRDQMPPLEDLILGGRPGPIGTSCIIAVIVGGLFLLYRGLIDFRIPLVIFAAMYAALLILPVPTLIAQHRNGTG